MERRTLGTVLAVFGAVLLVSTLTTSALVAPDRSVDASDGNETKRTLVGVQGGGPGWHDHGSVALFEGPTWRDAPAGRTATST